MDKEKQELKHIMVDARAEIIQLRRDNEILSAKVEVMELLGDMVRAKLPENRIGAQVDVAWQLQCAINNIEEKQ